VGSAKHLREISKILRIAMADRYLVPINVF
jgi:hypothetical protein